MGKPNRWFIFYFVLSALYLTSILIAIPQIQFFGKPLLLVPLIIAGYGAKAIPQGKWLVISLIFSWSGDILLLFTGENGIFFILGLVAFLIAHIFLILLFYNWAKHLHPTTKWDLPAIALILLYLGLLLRLLSAHLGALAPEVILYSLAIGTMLYMARRLSAQWSGPPAGLLLSGAIFFVVSDSMLAIQKFYHPFPFSSFLIMATYLYAQFGMVKGCLSASSAWK